MASRSGARVGKRSVVGTRVAVPVLAAGETLWVPAVITSTRVLGLETSFCVSLTPQQEEVRAVVPKRAEFRAEQMVGPGFQSVGQAVRGRLAPGQPVFLTLRGREVAGSVVSHHDSDVLVAIHESASSLLTHNVRRPLAHLRLLPSRKSARLEHHDQDYSRLLHQPDQELDTLHKKEEPAHFSILTQGRKRRTSGSTEDLVMDDCSAAMVLMSLSCSPKSPLFAANRHAQDRAKFSHSWTSGCSADSGFPFDSPASTSTIRSSTPSPPSDKKSGTVSAGDSLLSRSPQAQAAGEEEEDQQEQQSPASPSSSEAEVAQSEANEEAVQETLDLQEEMTTGIVFKQRKVIRKRIIFACTWPGCDARSRTNGAIERHVRQQHSVEPGEEDFYFTEIEQLVRVRAYGGQAQQQALERLSPSAASMDGLSSGSSNCSSQSPVASPGPAAGTASGSMMRTFKFGTASMPTWSHMDMARPAHEDPEYQRQLKQQQQARGGHSVPIAIPGMSFTHDEAFAPTPKVVNGHKFMRVLSEQGVGLKVSPGSSLLAASSGGLSVGSGSAVSPKSRVGRSRGDARKCRKVYGMESRDLWCTQCKWKKACTRFHD